MKRLACLALFALLAGCTQAFNAKVSRFQQLPPPAGESFVVQAADPQQRGGLEFGQYARLVSARLVEHGYRPAENPAQADLVVTMRYGVDNGRERIESNGLGYGRWGYGPFGYGPFGYGGGYYGRGFVYGFYDPFLFGGGFGNDIRSYTVYQSELDLQIERTNNGQRLFEGTAKAQSTDDSLPNLVPKLIDAMFSGFPAFRAIRAKR